MSLTKRWLEEEAARAYYTSSDSVCARCFYDKGIRRFIRNSLTERQCSVCKRRSKKPIAAPADQVLAFVLARLHEHFESADGSAPFDKETWSYMVETWDMDELISEEMADAAPFETLEWVTKHLSDEVTYCRRDWQVMSPGEALTSAWEKFSKAIKHETRFMFFREEHDDFSEPFLVRPAQMLDELGDAIRRCKLVHTLKAGTPIYRVRGHSSGEVFTTGPELGPPPEEFARSAGRMNAPGIVVTYASFHPDTAVLEAAGDSKECSVGEFELLQDIRVVDLTNVPKAPSIFESGPRESLQFLNRFSEAVSQPFTPDLEVHVEYTPTQVVSEYLRHRFRDKRKKPVRGVIYSSAKSGAAKNLALFMAAEEVAGAKVESWKKKAPLIRLVSAQERVLSPNDEPSITRPARSPIETPSSQCA